MKPKIWKPFVDNIFAIIKKSHHDVLLQHLNEKIEFTSEEEKDGRLPFMDTLVSRRDGGALQLDVYQKPSQTAQYLSFASHHPLSSKKSVVSSRVHRAHKVSSGEHLRKKEIACIDKQLEINGYPRSFIMRTADDVERRIASKNREVEDQSNTDEPDPTMILTSRTVMPTNARQQPPTTRSLTAQAKRSHGSTRVSSRRTQAQYVDESRKP